MTSATSISDLINGLYAYSTSIVGLFVFLMFLYAGILLMMGRSGAKEKAIKILQDAVIGTVLLFSAVTILNTINKDYTCQREFGGPPINCP